MKKTLLHFRGNKELFIETSKRASFRTVRQGNELMFELADDIMLAYASKRRSLKNCS